MNILGLSAPDLDQYLTVADAAELLGVPPWDVMRLIENGSLPTLTLIARDHLTTIAKESQ